MIDYNLLNIIKKILRHFKLHDPILYHILLHVEKPVLTKSQDYFLSLCREIISQQLSGKAAKSIFTRFLKLFPKQKPNAQKILKVTDQTLRDVGMSWAKVKYLKDLSQKVVDKKLLLSKLDTLENNQVVEALTLVKGIGPWTAEMFLIFSLAREDVFSFGDLGLKKAIMKLYKIEKPTQNQLEKIVNRWKPYRSYAALILWKSLDNR